MVEWRQSDHGSKRVTGVILVVMDLFCIFTVIMPVFCVIFYYSFARCYCSRKLGRGTQDLFVFFLIAACEFTIILKVKLKIFFCVIRICYLISLSYELAWYTNFKFLIKSIFKTSILFTHSILE